MNLLNPVSTIMATDLITLTPDASISDAAKIFESKRVHHIPVTVDGQLLGIVSKSDYLFFRRGFLDSGEEQKIEEIRMNNYQVEYIMTKGIAKLDPNERINVALELFKVNIFHAIPIVDNDKLVGIVTTYDIINHLANDNIAVSEY
ncbi:MAG: CBS domain-containing protein [Saprospiraceae bacterium]